MKKATNIGSMKGVSCEFLIKKCVDCKKETMIHSFAERCPKCRNKHSYKGKYTYKYLFNKVPIIAVRPSDKIMCEGTTTKNLIDNLLEKFNITIPPSTIREGRAIKFGDILYWFYKGIIFVRKSEYMEGIIEEIFLARVRGAEDKKRDKVRDVTDEIKKAIVYVVNNQGKLRTIDIAKNLGKSKSWVTHILTGHSYSDITGIKYKRAYKAYNEFGDVVAQNQRVSSKTYKGSRRLKKVVYTSPDGTTEILESVREASLKTGVAESTIYFHVQGKVKTSKEGHKFDYKT